MAKFSQLRLVMGAVCGALMCFQVAAEPAQAGEAGATFGAETFTLSNGMRVVVVSNHRAPVVHHAVWYRVGAADEPPGKSGIAHMLEHLMFKGTPTVPAGEFSKIVSRNGGNDNAFTAQDYTGYFQNIARDRLEMVMEMEADRMVNLDFGDEDFLTERQVVLEERRSRTDNRPRAQFSEQLSAAQYLSHPYGLPVIGWEHEIRAYTAEDSRVFYSRHYAPNNAILVVVGDITADELRAMAERIYGPIAAKPIPERARPTEPPQRAARVVEMADPRVASVEWSRSYLAPSYRTGDPAVIAAMEVLSQILGGGTTSRLYQALVVDQKIADHAGSYFNGVSFDQSSFVLYGLPRNGVDTEAVVAAVEAEIARLVADGVADEELQRAKFGMIAQATYARDNLSTVARIFGVALTAGLAVEDVEAWPSLVEAVTAADVIAAAESVFKTEQSVSGVLRPAAESS